MKKIFCEGIGDQIFIADFIEYHFDIIFQRDYNKKNDKIKVHNAEIEIISIDGCTKIREQIYKEQFIDNTEKGGVNIVVFDADYKDLGNGNNGFESCCQKLDDLKNDLKDESTFDYFLWPDNENDGYLEDVQRKMIPELKLPILSCMDSHFSCLDSLRNDNNLKVFTDKDKISIYLYYCQKDSRPSFVRYNEEEYWNLKVEENEPLLKFKNFLIEKLELIIQNELV